MTRYYISVKKFRPQEHKETERKKVYTSDPQNEILHMRKMVRATHRLLDYFVTFFKGFRENVIMIYFKKALLT
jgi:hypothetical protein